ncbi:helix-turn-helix transcriptional regulator [Fulvivirgaceae bacterium BMA10]|uniref:Helix-turn-helix transcriptional regulator n=1 Tax=Splendidivirga corallicola TaxID=3051826 RepID=A0ABT8KSP5_9BACT|nr:helix-turn-helix transcriptional regulator [Fulvivirgaceae bacterium BMA10]
MKGTYIGEFEELILLMVGVLYDEAYGVAIMHEIESQTDRRVNISAVHSALKRLEEKGFLNSRMGGATSERGGRRKRYFTLTSYGKKALDEANALRNQLYHKIPKMAWMSGS